MTSPIRFIDASVFVHAYLKPKRPLKPHEAQIKEDAKKIIARISRGEPVLTTVVHLGEIANIIEDHTPLDEALTVEGAICLNENVEIVPVVREDYITALDEADNHKIGLTDALAYVAMKKNGLHELYSFDKDFDRLKDIKRLRS